MLVRNGPLELPLRRLVARTTHALQVEQRLLVLLGFSIASTELQRGKRLPDNSLRLDPDFRRAVLHFQTETLFLDQCPQRFHLVAGFEHVVQLGAFSQAPLGGFEDRQHARFKALNLSLSPV